MTGAGLTDLQVNGFAGVDFNTADPDIAGFAARLDMALETMLATGVTCCLPTVITAPPILLAERLSCLDAALSLSRLGPLMCPGFHLEGPFLNRRAGFSGCHPADAMSRPDYGLVSDLESRLSRPILMLTLAPELDGATACIGQARAAGKLVSLGHTNASFADVDQAVAAGATMSTHLGNGLPQILPKLANPIFAQLSEDALHASFIADGVHVPQRSLKAMIRAKGLRRSFLVTDATAAAAAPAGDYPFAGLVVRRDATGLLARQGEAVQLNGSSLTLDKAVRNLVAWDIASRDDALSMASENPETLLAPCLAAHGLVLPRREVDWSPELIARRVQIGNHEIVSPRGGLWPVVEND